MPRWWRRLGRGRLPVVEPGLDDLLASNRQRDQRFTAERRRPWRRAMSSMSRPTCRPTTPGRSDLSGARRASDLRARRRAGPRCGHGGTVARCRRAIRARSAFAAGSGSTIRSRRWCSAVPSSGRRSPSASSSAAPIRRQPLPDALRAVLEAFGCPILPMRYESAELAKISINCCLVASISVGQYAGGAVRADRRRLVGDRAGAEARPPDRALLPILRPALASLAAISSATWPRSQRLSRRPRHRGGRGLGLAAQQPAPPGLAVARNCMNASCRGSASPVIGVLGVTYKENTHSIKNSPAVALIKELGELPAARVRPGGAGRGGMASAHDSGRGRAVALRRRRRPRHHDAVAAVPSAQARRYRCAAAWARCDRSLFDVRPCRDGCRRPRTCRTRSAFAGARMTLSHVHNRPRMPDRVVVLGASGFLGRGLARGLRGCGYRDHRARLARGRSGGRRGAARGSPSGCGRATWSCSCRRSRPTRAATPAR